MSKRRLFSGDGKGTWLIDYTVMRRFFPNNEHEAYVYI